MTDRTPLPKPDPIPPGAICNSRLLLPYAAPYFAYVGVAMFLRTLSVDWNYALRMVSVVALLAWGWRWYVPLTGPKNAWVSCGWGGLVGVAGSVLWVAMIMPFVGEAAEPWDFRPALLRLLAATLLVPLFEELLMRGFVLRLALQWGRERAVNREQALDRALWQRSIDTVEPGAWNGPALAVSTLAFASGHQVYEWPAAMVYGLLMALLWIWRKDLISCIAAHAATNLVLGIYVYHTQSWHLW